MSDIFAEMRDLYSAEIIERGRRPRHMGRMAEFDASAKGDNPMCGDRIQVFVRLAADGGIAQAGYDARGCELTKASADLMVEAVQGLSPADTRAMFAEFAQMARSGVCPSCAPPWPALRPLANVAEYPSRIKCATLPWTALVAALDGRGESSSE